MMRSDNAASAPACALVAGEGLREALFTAFDRAFDWLFCLLFAITITLPSGTVHGVNLKSPLYLALLPLAGFSFFYRGQATGERVAVLLGVPAILSGWMVLGVAQGFPLASALRQYTDIVLVLLLCWLALVFRGEGRFRQMRFLRLVVYSEVAASLLKAGIIAYALARGIPTVEVVDGLSKVFGVNLMTMDLGAMFGRVQFVSDALIPVCVFIVLRHRDSLAIGSVRSALILLLLLVSVVFGFSRYTWAFTAAAFVGGLMTGRRDRFQLVLALLLGAAVLASLPALTVVYELRFSADVAGSSDLIRTEQTSALDGFFEDAPIFGHGLGSYTTQVVRAEAADGGMPYSYEDQILALAGQMGLAGLTLLALLTAYAFSDLWWRTRAPLKDRLAIAGLLAFWLAAGLYNPLLFHPVAGVIYASFATLAAMARELVAAEDR